MLFSCRSGCLQAAESQQIFPSPAAQSFLINGRKHRVTGRQATLVPATPDYYIEKSIIFAKIFRLRVP